HGIAATLWIDLYRAGLDRLKGRTPEARRRLMRVEQSAVRLRYRSIHGRALWQDALLSAEANSFAQAFTGYQRALALFEKAHDRESVAILHALIASQYCQLGEIERGWTNQALALQGLYVARR